MRHLAIGCVFRSIGRKAWDDATKSVKLLSTVLGVHSEPSIRAVVWAELGTVVVEICSSLRVNNARCNENVAVESAEF